MGGMPGAMGARPMMPGGMMPQGAGGMARGMPGGMMPGGMAGGVGMGAGMGTGMGRGAPARDPFAM